MMATYHILTGDALAGTFKRTSISGDVIISRECLVDGPVSGNHLSEFWKQRAEFIHTAFNANVVDYYRRVKSEFDKIRNITKDDEVNLWFENDLFCQTNMWFTISLLTSRNITAVYRVSPLIRTANKWEGFGRHTPTDLNNCFKRRQPFGIGDFQLGENLWEAFRHSDLIALAYFSESLSPCFPYLEEVCKAEMERKRNARPRKVLEDLLAKGYTNFDEIFSVFNQTEAIYGFGDVQVSNILKDIGK